jgi:hypothetical protein
MNLNRGIIMAKYYDLNKLVKTYVTSGEKEFKELMSRLKNVPVSLVDLEKMIKAKYNEDLSDLRVTSYLESTDMRILLLDDLTDSNDEADSITGRIIMPYPVVLMSGQNIGSYFYDQNKKDFGKLLVPDARDPDAKVLSHEGVPGVAVIFKRDKKSRDKKLEYIEIVLSKNYLY